MRLLERRGFLQCGGWGIHFEEFLGISVASNKALLRRTNNTVGYNWVYWFDSEQSFLFKFYK